MRQLKITNSITSRGSQSLEDYLNDISKQPLLTTEEEVKLAQRIRNDDREALERLVCANLRFVVSVAKQYQNQGLTLPDLINEGNIGLIKAAEKFDETRGFKFISYAVWWIRQSILQALAEQSRMVRLPLNQVSAVSRINKLIMKFEQEHERKPSAYELSELIDETPEKIRDSLRANGRPMSMDAPLGDGDDSTLLEVISDDNMPSTDGRMIDTSLATEIDRMLDTLDEREKTIVEMCFGINNREMTLDEISEKFGLSRERVRQIREKALLKLRHSNKKACCRSTWDRWKPQRQNFFRDND